MVYEDEYILTAAIRTVNIILIFQKIFFLNSEHIYAAPYIADESDANDVSLTRDY